MAGNISTAEQTNQLYKYVATMTLVFDGGEPLELGMLYIKGIIVDYKYDVNHFPIILLTAAFQNSIRDLMIEHEKTASVILQLQKYVSNGDNQDLKITCWEGNFGYVLPPSITTKGEKQKVENPEERKDVTTTYTIGLSMMEHVNLSKKLFNNVIRKGSLSSIVNNLLSDRPLLMEPLSNNVTIKEIPVTPQCSLYSALIYLNNLHALYNSRFRFFMDFDISYMLSSSGTITKRKGEKYNDVIINIRDEYNEANMEGMTTDAESEAYIINVSGNYVNKSDTNLTDKTFNHVSTGSSNDTRAKAELSAVGDDSEYKDNITYLRLPNNNKALLDAMEYQSKLDAIMITLTIAKVDTTIFTLNKKYTINADISLGPEYTGQYLLSSRRDIYVPEGEGFNVNCILTFKKIPG